MTPAQAVTQRMYQSLWALRQLGLHLGMFPTAKAFEPSEEELRRRQELVGRDRLLSCLNRVLDPDCHPIPRAAMCAILDYAAWGWRDKLPRSLLGYVIERDSPQVRVWRQKVLARDNHRCRQCGSTEELHAHHIARWADAPELRVEIDNGMTLCRPCHKAVHSTAHGQAVLRMAV
jgi:hypothetical protein